MSLENDLFAIEQGFWLGGEDHFLKNLDDQCLLAFPQAGGMHGIHSREEVAATAKVADRWRDLNLTGRCLVRLTDLAAIISYRADVTRSDGRPYSALVSSAYVARASGWKLAFHQHSPI